MPEGVSKRGFVPEPKPRKNTFKLKKKWSRTKPIHANLDDFSSDVLEYLGPYYEYEDVGVPTVTHMLTCIGYQSKGSWHDLKKRGDDWLEFCRYVETLLEDWLFRRMVRPEKGDNAIGISVVLQAKYGWSTSNKQILAGSKGEPIETRVTPQEVTRALDDL